MPADIEKLRRLVIRLRSPDGCPWDREQTLESVRAYLLEEAHETAAAIDSGDRQELCGELGDLLFQAVFIAGLAEEEDAFDLAAAVDGVHDKMIERHPHVFGTDRLEDAAAVHRAWERRKLEQKKTAGGNAAGEPRSLLGGVPASLPALTGAQRMTQKAAGVGFDWPEVGPVLEKVREELAEVDELLTGGDLSRQREEIGDLLFAVVNLARHLGIDAEAALAGANQKFRRRFAAVEANLAERGRSPVDASLDEMDAIWQEVKEREPGH